MNDGDIKVIANKFLWKYLRQGKVNLRVSMSNPSQLHRLATQHFDQRSKSKMSESFSSQPEHTIWVSRERTLITQYLHLGAFLWKENTILAICENFRKLQSFCWCTPLLTLTYIFLFRHLPTEIVIFINFCYQVKCFSGDRFSLF